MSNSYLYTPQQAATELECSVTTVNRLVKQGLLTRIYLTPGIKRGGCPRITQNSLHQYLATLCAPPHNSPCTEASAANRRSSVWQQSTKGRTRPITGAAGKDPTAQELGERLGVL